MISPPPCHTPLPVPRISQAAHAAADDDLADYNNELRMGILEAYSGLFQVGWGRFGGATFQTSSLRLRC